ncbi:MAG: nicotinate-nucleotide adenylyltransferase [Gammaproteobacteria bacterium]|jgi:nicotinate-nucleotide adenylyltransferase
MIGILGGTFDPVHFGHLRPALEVRVALGLDEIRLIPCHLPPHRPPPVATPRQRLAMLQNAIAGHAGFVIDERELYRDGPSYTLDTLLSLHADLRGTDLCLLVGMDAFRGLTSWHRWHELIEHCHIVVMTRPGAIFPEHGELGHFIGLHRAFDPAMLRAQSAGLLYFQEVSQLEISGTHIRALLGRGEAADFLLPDGVLNLITEQDLYTSDSQ